MSARAPLSSTVRLIVKPLRLAAALCSTLLAGCWPYHYTERPGVKGEVVSADGSGSIPAAIVVVNTTIRRSPLEQVRVTTDANGRFVVAARRYWAGYSPMQDSFGASSCFVQIDAPTFATEKIPFQCSDTGPAMTDLHTIQLRRQQ